MAFYFALLNVASRKEEKQPRVRRRRHSIASVESPLLDYRLLPRPRVVSKELAREENDDSDEPGPSVRRRSRNRENRAMKKSESSYSDYKKTDQNSNRDQSSEAKNVNEEPVVTDEFAEHKKSEKQNRKDERLCMNQIWTPEMIITLKNDLTPTDKPSCLLTSAPKASRNVPQSMRSISPRLNELQNDSITTFESKTDKKRRKDEKRSKSADKEHNKRLQMSRATQANVHLHENPNNLRSTRRGKGGRPLIVKRRISPTESTTSGSRRSSKESQRSLQRKDSPASSISSAKESDNKHLMSPSNNHNGPSYLSKYANDKVPQLKKVTFETVNSPYVINRSFLGERAVLVRRSSGCETVLRNSTSDPSEKIAMPHSGEEWLKRLEQTDEIQNSIGSMANICIMDRPVKSCLLRRRSTSDRRHLIVAYAKNNVNKDLMTLSVDRPQNL
ncbi:unnamed protein product [Auanema sp. JU1783]|nr:unnamed protein product [Auanema sp. JU1783]